MNFRSAGLGAYLLAVAIAGCGTVPASAPDAGHPTASVTHTQAPSTSTAGTGVRSSCQRPADDTLTLASNGKNYCVRVGEQLDVYLQGTLSRPWLVPLASSDVLVPVPNGGMSLPVGLTGESFAAARSGQVLITSIRSPCSAAAMHKNEAQPSGSLPRVYPLGFCPPKGRFSVSITVLH
jgi:hypothetical protein